MNRLQHETSPYLLQHKDNPVAWYPWGDEAFAQARAQDRPVLLSVGYSACHWCHVMAHESFEDEATAAMMNAHFINVKVDREERPDVDDIYMGAVQAISGQGGWPMTVFLLPDGRPFYGGTYFPPQPRMGMPSFQQILAGVADAYNNRRDEVERSAVALTESLDRDILGIGGMVSDLNADLLQVAVGGILRNIDPEYGGFRGAPKFPQPMIIEFLLRAYARTGSGDALSAVRLTLDRMAQGGIYDQLAGGFHRYTVDAIWLVPHFEKMLYDNAQLARVYLHGWQVTQEPFYQRIAAEVLDYLLREMADPEGGFYSATDADSEGEEGKFFVWTIAELEALLGADDAALAVAYWGMTARGNFEGRNILYVPRPDAEMAQQMGLDVGDLQARLADIRDTLYAARTQRVEPGLDDKVLTAWNGLTLAALAEAARVLNRDDYREAAVRLGDFLLRVMRTEDGALLRSYRHGKARLTAYLEDYANVIDGLLELYQVTFDERWFIAARQLTDYVLAHFKAEDGGFFDTSDVHEALIVRPRNVQDNATPSGSAMMARQLLRLAAYTGEGHYYDAAADTLRLLSEAMRQYPQAFGEALNAVDMLVSQQQEVALIGAPDDARTQALLSVLYEMYRPNTIVALSAATTDESGAIPLLYNRIQRDQLPTVYVCRNFACALPVTTPAEMRPLLGGAAYGAATGR